MRDAVICAPLRTPVGRYGGSLRDIPAAALAAVVIRAIIERTGLDPERVEDVVLGQGYPSTEAPSIGRVAALDAGLPVSVPGAQVDRRCGAGLYAVLIAATQVQAGASDLLLAGGTECMSQAGYSVSGLRFGHPPQRIVLHDDLGRGRTTAGGANYPIEGGMVETAENLRAKYGVSRQAQDELALESHRRACAAQQSGRFDDEIVRVETGGTVVDQDEHPRADTSLEALARLRPLRAAIDPDATVTAGNASGQNDAAALCIVTTPEYAAELGLRPMLRLVSWAMAGVDPRLMGMGPVPASERALERAGLTMADMDLIELNEAFAAQVLSVTRAWGFGAADFERLNVNGSGISLGHPIGATGARILATLAHEVDRRQARYALATLCIGGGQGISAVWERAA